MRITHCYRKSPLKIVVAPQALRLLMVGSKRRATALLARLGCAWRLSSAALSMKHALAAHDSQAQLLASMQKATKKARVQYCQSALPGVAGATLACACLVILCLLPCSWPPRNRHQASHLRS